MKQWLYIAFTVHLFSYLAYVCLLLIFVGNHSTICLVVETNSNSDASKEQELVVCIQGKVTLATQ